MTQIPSHLYAIKQWFALAQGDEPLLIRILADTAGLKGWLARDAHDVLSVSDLETVLNSDWTNGFELAATHLLSQMPQFNGPTDDQSWQQWLTNWQQIHKQKSAAEQLDLLPQRFDHSQAEQVMEQLLSHKTDSGEIPVIQSH